MIGVMAEGAARAAAAEFFELFKTPWEFCRQGVRYETVLSDRRREDLPEASLLIVSSPAAEAGGAWRGAAASSQPVIVTSFTGSVFVLYGPVGGNEGGRGRVLLRTDGGVSVALSSRRGAGAVVELGYDLFGEIGAVLGRGQPAAMAEHPTVERHVEFLRHVILEHGGEIVEVPPVPRGYRFIICLTHDIDFYSLRRYLFTRTMAGFLYRSTGKALLDLLHGRSDLRKALRNATAVLKVPLVAAGAVADPWELLDAYAEIEGEHRSTFYFIPFRGREGRRQGPPTGVSRACRCDINDVEPAVLSRLKARGKEIGLHGIDAWWDPAAAREERQKVAVATGSAPAGVRMHWLYRDEETSAVLERAGFLYDSTMGFNETIGFRAGTTQVYRPLGAANFYELPMHVMDTALLYSKRMGLSEETARGKIATIMRTVAGTGGVLTVNWHDRSIGPERWWGDLYRYLLASGVEQGAWITCAVDVVRWFEKRRRATLMETGGGREEMAELQGVGDDGLPGLSVVRHRLVKDVQQAS